MKIKFGATFQLKGIGIKDFIEIEDDEISVRDFLLEITRLTGNTIQFFEQDDSIDDQNYIVSVNGTVLLGMPREMEQKLRDGDKVYISFPMLGGG